MIIFPAACLYLSNTRNDEYNDVRMGVHEIYKKRKIFLKKLIANSIHNKIVVKRSGIIINLTV